MIGNSTSRTLRIILALGALAAAAWPTLAAEKDLSRRGAGRPASQRARVPRDAGAQRDAGPRLLPRGPPGRSGHHPERRPRGHERRPAPRPARRASGSRCRRSASAWWTRRRARSACAPSTPTSRRTARASTRSSTRTSASPTRCACGRRARRSASSWTSSSPCRGVGRPGRLQPGAVPRDPLRQVLRDRDAGRDLPAPGQRPGRARREGASTRSHRSPPESASSSLPSPIASG